MNQPTRRRFLRNVALASGSAFSPNLLFGKPSTKALNVACVGCGGKGAGDIGEIAKGNHFVAFCDIDHKRGAKAFARNPDAKRFFDFREMFDALGDQIDVVTVSTPDHMHFPVALEAIRRGKPVMVQKPLCNTIWEARALANLAEKKGVFTVMGNQGATYQGTRRLREWIEAGLIGEVKEVHYWTNRPIWPQGKGLEFPEAKVPKSLRWDLFHGGVLTERPYSPKIHPFAWRGFWDYGCGALGDIGCHSFNSAFWALNLSGDFTVETSDVSDYDEVTAPKRSRITYDFPAKGDRAAVKVIWQDGVKDPNKDKDFIRPPGIPDDLELPKEYGQVFVGTEGALFCNEAYCRMPPVVYPEKLRAKAKEIPRRFESVSGGPTQELCRAVRGEGAKPVSNFVDHAGPLTEMVLAGNLAIRLGKKIDWDAAAMEVRGAPEARPLIKRAYREGWEPKIG